MSELIDALVVGAGQAGLAAARALQETGLEPVVLEAGEPRLFAPAYRLLGSATDAENVVQEAFLRWDKAVRRRIDSPPAWLARVVTNLSLNILSSARVRRERYVGPWLPEPDVTDPGKQCVL